MRSLFLILFITSCGIEHSVDGQVAVPDTTQTIEQTFDINGIYDEIELVCEEIHYYNPNKIDECVERSYYAVIGALEATAPNKEEE
jgi:hypothetical protein